LIVRENRTRTNVFVRGTEHQSNSWMASNKFVRAR
jgi:hypothetical protein